MSLSHQSDAGNSLTESKDCQSFPGGPGIRGFPGGSVKKPPAGAGGTGLVTGSGRSLGEGNGSPLQYSCLGNPMDRGAWWAAVRGVAEVRYDLETKQQRPVVKTLRSQCWRLPSIPGQETRPHMPQQECAPHS